MKSHLFRLFFMGCAALVIASCSRQPSSMTVTNISIDFNHIKTIDLDSDNVKVISLEATDQSLLYYINGLQFFKNNIMILTKDKLCVFDSNGKFLFNAGSKGRGPEEYVDLSGFFIQNEHINVFDSDSKRVLSFDENGKFISSSVMSPDENHHFPAVLYATNNDSYYVGKNRFSGDHVQTPTLSIWTKEYKPFRDITGRYLTTGLFTPDMLSCYQDEILYWEILNDTIFSVREYQQIMPKYHVDFRDKAIPNYEKTNKSLYELMQYTNRPEVVNGIASRIGHVKEDERYVRFIFMYQKRVHYVKYDKNNQSVSTYCFTGDLLNLDLNYFMYMQDDNIILSASIRDNYDENPVLLVINEKTLTNNEKK